MLDPLRQVAERRAELARPPRSKRSAHDRIRICHAVRARAAGPLALARSRAMQSCDEDERVEQRLLRPIVGRGLLRVPLNAHHPGGPLVLLVLDGSLDRLDEPVRAPAGRREPVADAVDALMMVRTAGQRAALGERREPAAGERVDVMRRLRVLHRDAVRERTGQVGEVLRAACRRRRRSSPASRGRCTASASTRRRPRAPTRSRARRARDRPRRDERRAARRIGRDRRHRHPRAAARPTARARRRRSPGCPGGTSTARPPARCTASTYGAGTPYPPSGQRRTRSPSKV